MNFQLIERYFQYHLNGINQVIRIKFDSEVSDLVRYIDLTDHDKNISSVTSPIVRGFSNSDEMNKNPVLLVTILYQKDWLQSINFLEKQIEEDLQFVYDEVFEQITILGARQLYAQRLNEEFGKETENE